MQGYPIALGVSVLAGFVQSALAPLLGVSPWMPIMWLLVAAVVVWEWLWRSTWTERWDFRKKKLATILVLPIVVGCMVLAVVFLQPRIRFVYENKPPWLMFIPEYEAYRIAVEIKPNLHLANVSAHLKSITRIENGQPRSINQGSKVKLGWPDDELAFQSRNVSPTGDFVVLFLGSKDGRTLYLFTSAKYRYIQQLKDAVPPGEYELVFEIDAQNIASVSHTTQTMRLQWSGDIRDFRMTLD